MSNTLIILAVLGVVNFLIRKFAATKTKATLSASEDGPARKPEVSASKAVSAATTASGEPQPTWWARTAKALQEASEQADSGELIQTILKSANTSQIASKAQAQINATLAAATAAARAASQPKPVKVPGKVKRASQAPIGVTYSQREAPQATPHSAVHEPDTKPISAIDSLIASRMSQKIGSITASNRPAGRNRKWTARSMRQGIIMAEILSPPLALRSPR
ncbi:MAG: hypothetical protein K8R92_03025 [Planctomycetes bacterium]|nr:hypothetical protein [Planctomycetota bacterium]